MAQSFSSTEGLLIIPGGYASFSVAGNPGGLATTGVLVLVGESEAGPHWSLEDDLGLNSFGPDQAAEVTAKYKSGPLVEAFKGAIAAANDPQLTGSFFRAILVKTNNGGDAGGSLFKYGGGVWAQALDKSYGKLGNLISYQVVAKTTEVPPMTGDFTFLPPIAATDINFRVDGGSALPISISALETPTAFQTAVDALAGVTATGGVDRQVLGSVLIPGSLTVSAVVGLGITNTISILYSVSYGALAVAGDTLVIPAGSVVAGAGSANVGSYIVVSASTTTITAKKFLNASGAVLVAPVAVSIIASDSNDEILVYSPVNISSTATTPVVTAGVGKTLEIAELTSAAGLLRTIAYFQDTTGPAAVTWISKVSTPYTITGTQYVAQINASRELDSTHESISAGGAIALKLSYKGTTASYTNDGTTIVLTFTGGAGTGSPISLRLADYATIGDLASYINSLTGFKATPGTAVMGQQPPTSLDYPLDGAGVPVAINIATTQGAYTGLIKQDAYKLFKAVAEDSLLVSIGTRPPAGLPAPSSIAYFTGGTKGATTDAGFNAAIDAAEFSRANFVVPLFSRNAADDVLDNVTDSGSSYTIANIHAYTKAHCLKLSTLKRKRNRQCFLSVSETFANQKSIAADIAHPRCAMTFQDVKDVGPTGVKQYQPWMAAVKAAAMQAAAFYRSIVRKGISISGALHSGRDFNDQDDSKMEDALLAGLLPIRRSETGGFHWVSDQTTYGKDNNFVWNSCQAVYAADVISLTLAQQMEIAFVGQSIADTNASLALMVVEATMADLKRLKLISASDDAPKGFKNAQIKINGPVMQVALEAKLSGTIYFVPISILISQVTQSAG